jgi:hypothetical protein
MTPLDHALEYADWGWPVSPVRFNPDPFATQKVSKHAVFRWIEAKHLPVGRLGSQILGSQRVIRAHLERAM